MKNQLITFITFLLVSSASSSYWLLSEPDPQPKPPVILKSQLKTAETVQPLLIQKIDNVAPKPVLVVQKTHLDETSLYTALNQTLTALTPNQALHLSNVDELVNCPSCLQLLQNTLLNGNLSRKQLEQLANSLAKTNQPKFATLLIETLEKTAQQTAGIENDSPLINAIAQFNSPAVAKEFISYLARWQQIPMQLENALIQNINEVKNRVQVANEIVEQFNTSSDSAVRDKLLAINQPEALAKIYAQAVTQGNTVLAKQTLELFTSNPSKYALDAGLSILHNQTEGSIQATEILEGLRLLAQRQFSGNRLDYIETKFSGNFYPEQDRAVVLDILAHSEDAKRAGEMIAKFSPSPLH